MGDHIHGKGLPNLKNGNSRPELSTLAKRPMIEASSHAGPGVKQKTVKTTLGESEAVILNHQAGGWRIESSLAIGGNEVLLTFGR
jgi:hypothetical protein